ncbi:MAG: DUF362 domain-containing protein [Candidatus Tectimicrobiota bacterium]
MLSSDRRVALCTIQGDVRTTIREALEQCGILTGLSSTTRVALKPNLTYPYYKPGVTTSPEVMRATVHILREYTSHLAIVETDGGYGAWAAKEAFQGHGLYQLREEYGVEIVNLCDEPREWLHFQARGRRRQLPLPTRLLHDTDLFITMPVPKIHCMTGLSLSYKNQWGCVPDIMRLRSHHMFSEAIVAINRRLKPMVLADGTFFLNRTGPMEGDPVRMNLIIAATDVGAFDLYVSELMGFSWGRVQHLRRAVRDGEMPSSLDQIAWNIHPAQARTQSFHLERTPRNWLALAGFHSRFITWFGYESWFGRVVLHAILYALVGRPVKPVKPLEEG